MSSILTNNGAIVALQTLKGINASLTKTQSEISTGKTVASAKDNAAVWAIAKVMETDQESFKTVQSQLNVASATVATASAGAEQITKLLTEMKQLAVGAAKDGADFTKIQTEIADKEARIAAVVEASQMNGINLLKADVGNGTATFSVIGSLDRVLGTAATTKTEIDVDSVDFETDIVGAGVTDITDKASALSAIGEIEDLLDVAINGAAALGSGIKSINDQADFVGKLSDALKQGVGSLVDADMEEASARLQALQTQQQLGIQSLSIANQAPQSILALFRG